ncbi:MAG: MoaD family protein [Candidatus Bipolaricaulota bacterium]|nr:MAG: MoaD family protein [Candidatus Bipolaricaulota bacterium]
MIVAVEISFSFKREIDERDLALELPAGASVVDAMHALASRYPQLRTRLFDGDGQILRHINALINGGNASFRQGFETVLRDGDRLTLLPPVGGG